MEKIYVPSVLVGLDDFGTKIVSRFKDILEEKYERISIFWQSQSVNIDEVCEKVKELRGREKELKFADVPFFNFIAIAESEFCLDVNYLEGVNIRKIHITKELKENTKFDGTVYLFSPENERREKISESELEDKILYFLLILICSSIYDKRDYDRLFFPPNSILSLGIDVICSIHIKEYLKKKYINDFLTKFNQTVEVALDDNEKKELKEKNKKWLVGNSILKELIDLNNLHVKPEPLAPVLPFFTGAEFRKMKIQEYLKKAKTNIRKYLVQKKEKARSLRIEIEKRLVEKLSTLEKSRIEFLTELTQKAPEHKLGNILKDIIKSDEILGISELLKEKNKNLKWAKLSDYDNFRFPENAPHPNWLVMLILILIALIPTIVEIVIPKIPLFSYLKWSLVFSLPFIIYTIFSIVSLSIQTRKIITEWLSKIKIVDNFFARNFNKDFDSVHNFYEIWYLNMFRIFFKNKIPQIEEFLSRLDNIKRKTEVELDELKRTIESGAINELNKIEAKYDFKSLFIAYLNKEKPEGYLNRIATNFSNDNVEKAREVIVGAYIINKKIDIMVNEVTGCISLPMLYNPSKSRIVSSTKLRKFVFYSDQIQEFAAIKNPDIEKFEIDYPIFYGVVIVAELEAK